MKLYYSEMATWGPYYWPMQPPFLYHYLAQQQQNQNDRPPPPELLPIQQQSSPASAPAPSIPTRYTIEEITPLIRTIVREIYETEVNTMEFELAGDDDDDDANTGVALESLRLHTSVICLQSIPANDTLCAVCHDEYQVNDITRKLRCNHFFHMSCIDRVLESGENCPMCRVSVVPDDEDDEDDDDDDDDDVDD